MAEGRPPRTTDDTVTSQLPSGHLPRRDQDSDPAQASGPTAPEDTPRGVASLTRSSDPSRAPGTQRWLSAARHPHGWSPAAQASPRACPDLPAPPGGLPAPSTPAHALIHRGAREGRPPVCSQLGQLPPDAGQATRDGDPEPHTPGLLTEPPSADLQPARRRGLPSALANTSHPLPGGPGARPWRPPSLEGPPTRTRGPSPAGLTAPFARLPKTMRPARQVPAV